MKLFVLSGAGLETRPIVDRCQVWLSDAYSFYLHEWAVVESLFTALWGYKFQMCHGYCAHIQVLNSEAWYDGVNDFGLAKPPELAQKTKLLLPNRAISTDVSDPPETASRRRSNTSSSGLARVLQILEIV